MVTGEEFPLVAAAALPDREAQAAGAYVFGGGINEYGEPKLVSGDATSSPEIYPGSRLKGGVTVLELPTR